MNEATKPAQPARFVGSPNASPASFDRCRKQPQPSYANIAFASYMMNVVRIAVAIGFCVDLGVAILALFFQTQLGPLFDIPLKDPALTTIAGGEYIVVALIYVMVFRAPKRFWPLLWLCALDQTFAALLPALEIARGNVVATIKTIGPMPFNAILAAVYVWAARSDPAKMRAQPKS